MAETGRDLINTLYYGDNLEILVRFISDETVDLIYLDPPFQKNKAYTLIFKDESGRTSDAQLATFEDYWHWGPTPARHYEYLTNSAEYLGRVPHGVSELIGVLRAAIKPSPLLAYLVEMATRLVELHRVLKPTGTLYLHCDPTASHYLKIVLDQIFGPGNFLAEIVWKRTGAHSGSRRPGPVHDILLMYAKSKSYTWNRIYAPRDPAYVRSHFTMVDGYGRRFQPISLHAFGTVKNGATGRPWRGIDITAKGGHWKYSPERLEELDAAGLIYWPPVQGRMPRLKQLRRGLLAA